MKRKMLWLLPIVAVIAALALVGTAIADWEWQYNWWYNPFDHGWGKGTVYSGNTWAEYWDQGQGSYTYYYIDPSSYGQIYVASDSSSGVNTEWYSLMRSDSTRWSTTYYVSVYPGQYWWAYWPPSADMFAKPNPANDPSQIDHEYRWAGQGAHMNGDQFWYAYRNYYYYGY